MRARDAAHVVASMMMTLTTTTRASRCATHARRGAVGAVREWHRDAGGESAREGGDAAAMRAREEARWAMMMTMRRAPVGVAPVTMRGHGDVGGMHASFAMCGTREDDDEDEVDEGEDASARCPSDGGLGSKVLETWLMAVPKRKVTPSRRKRRNQFKRVPFIEEVVRCRVCGKANMPHVHCCDGMESVDRRSEPTPVTSSEI